MSIEENEKREETLRGQQPADQAQGGYGSPTPEDEMPDDAATNPGSPDPTLQGQETDEEALSDDVSLGAPDKSFFEDEEAGSDGEPGAGRLGGTDDQYREELDRAEGSAAHIAPGDESSLDLPSADAPLNDSNTEPAREDRESFSSEPDADADGAGR
ncbi:hypothetical protein [Arthrobacter alpinus]|uniref:hypothetical protein n=1 Tax=Specibacter sp. NPDC078692 TaxID=3155818 RepID=UPI00209FA195